MATDSRIPKDSPHHLPLYGIGPYLIGGIIALCFLGILFSELGWIPSARIPSLEIPMDAGGALLIACGVWMWISGALLSKLEKHIRDNELVRSGAFAHVRNPLYSAFIFMCTGAAMIEGNIYLLSLTPLYCIVMALVLSRTEEKWLLHKYADAYPSYAQAVPRTLPRIGTSMRVRMYTSDIPKGCWIALDIVGNIGWISYVVCTVLLLEGGTEGPLEVALSCIEVICSLSLLGAVAELTTQRIDHLDWTLPRIRLARGFGVLAYAPVAGLLFSLVRISLAEGGGTPSVIPVVMAAGSVLCGVCSFILLRRYREINSQE